jgi:hypothetical protein
MALLTWITMDNGLAAPKSAGLFDKPAPVNTESDVRESNEPESNSFERAAYLRDYMRKRRPQATL